MGDGADTGPPEIDEDDPEWDGEEGIYAIECSLGGASLVSGSRIVLADSASTDAVVEGLLRGIRAAALGFSPEVAMALEVRLLHGLFGVTGVDGAAGGV